jgi:hypothetical protein
MKLEGKMIMNHAYSRISKHMDMTRYNVLSQYLPGETEEKHENISLRISSNTAEIQTW